jgi:Mrp family chromosome partitioning ATPase
MNDQPRYATLRDYLRVVRQQRWLILGITLVFAGAALALSLGDKPTYQAEVSLRFVDPASDADLVGATSFPSTTPDALAAASAEVVTRPGVLQDVRRRLKTKLSVDELTKQVDAKPEALTNFVVVRATSNTSRFAAALANAFAGEVVRVTTKAERKRFLELAAAMRKSYSGQRRSTNQFSRELFAERVSRVKALGRTAEPVVVARAAEVPKDPISPKPTRNTILGGIIGLVLGLIIAFVRDSLDRRLRGSREIEEQLELPLLGHVSVDAMGRSLVSNNGHKVMTEADLEVFRIVRTNLEFLDVDNPAQIVLVTSGLPGEGKSTVSSALAATAALSGRRTLLVECDLRRPQIAERFGLGDGPGLSDYLAGRAQPAEVLRKVALGPPPSRNGNGNGNGEGDHGPDPSAPSLVCITAGSMPPRPAELLGSKKFAAFLEEVRGAYDFVVLDSSPLLSVSDTLELMPRVDGVILCVRAAQTTQEQARAAKAAIDRLPDRPTGLVVTGVKKGDAEDYGYYSYAYGRRR